MSGTNAHVILEEAPAPSEDAAPRTVERPTHVLALSGKSESALLELASRYAAHLATQEDEPGDVCHTAGVGRSHFEERLAVVGRRKRRWSRSFCRLSAEAWNPRW